VVREHTHEATAIIRTANGLDLSNVARCKRVRHRQKVAHADLPVVAPVPALCRQGAATYENRYLQQRIRSLTAKAKELGYELTAVTA
jgi:hypothetical protein